jgi:hypothetical protein
MDMDLLSFWDPSFLVTKHSKPIGDYGTCYVVFASGGDAGIMSHDTKGFGEQKQSTVRKLLKATQSVAEYYGLSDYTPRVTITPVGHMCVRLMVTEKIRFKGVQMTNHRLASINYCCDIIRHACTLLYRHETGKHIVPFSVSYFGVPWYPFSRVWHEIMENSLPSEIILWVLVNELIILEVFPDEVIQLNKIIRKRGNFSDNTGIFDCVGMLERTPSLTKRCSKLISTRTFRTKDDESSKAFFLVDGIV